jgi:hypothetical protein
MGGRRAWRVVAPGRRWVSQAVDVRHRRSRAAPCFTEPNLAFVLEERVADQVWLRVHFSLVALPPWVSGAEQSDIFDFSVVLDVPADQVGIAAADWAVALSRFPQR